MLEKEPSNRFQDYDILIETLESLKLACLSRERGSALKPPSPDRITVHEKDPLSPVRMDKKSEEGSGKRNLIIILLAFVLILASLVFILYRKEENMAGGNRRVIENLLNRFLLDSPEKSKPATIPNDTETTPRLQQ